jgi:RNA polymerase sigma factor (TIGR02999 family)
MRHTSSPVTEWLVAWSAGDESALQRLVPVVHAELRRIARREMRRERPEHTLQTTALVNEAYLRLVDMGAVDWNDRAHFFAMSARLMRRILVDHARARRYQKRGGGAPVVSFDEEVTIAAAPGTDLVALDDALQALAAIDRRKSDIVELRFFGGLGVEETAVALGISASTVLRDWRLARSWLFNELERRGRHGH